MQREVLNTDEVRNAIDQRGWKIGWVIKQLEMSRTAGHALLRDGQLPKDPERKSEVLERLAKLLGREVRQILLTLEAKRAG